MNSLIRYAGVALLAVLFIACSDDDIKKDVGLADSSAGKEASVDSAAGDSAAGDSAAQPDSTTPDSATPDSAADKGAPADAKSTVDGGALAASCAKLVKTCSTSLTWPQYIKPFTPANCVTLVNCVEKLYSGTCLTQFKSMVTCLGTITSATQCDSKCATYITYLTTNCACPKACGVACP